MKQLKLLFPILIFLSLSWLLSSCCVQDGYINSNNGFYFGFEDQSKITKIELMGTGRTINYQDSIGVRAHITLNPADTISSYRIFYENEQLQTSGSGIVAIKYIRHPAYTNDGCDDEALVIGYELTNGGTTFKGVALFRTSTGSIYVEIYR